ncbi:MAG: hypothetical protein IJ313_00255 [Clostridia bacterium]|nr:hypothetical protein [Clostridia bacterium]
MLSIIDLKKELGKNIYIYPVHIESIKSNSIDLHVSEYAWSLSTKKSIHNNGYIVIPPHDTALIYTEESIYVSNHIGGSYHSKVTLVSQGAGHIGTCLDAQYIGCSLIAIHNHSASSLKLKVGSEFVTVHFSYLNTPDYADAPSHDNEPGHPRMLNGFDNVDSYIEWRNQNTWTTRKKDLFLKMVQSDNYQQCKKEYQKELDEFNRSKIRKRIRKYFTIFALLSAICVLVSIPAYFVNWGSFSIFVKALSEKIIFPISVSFFTTFIIVDLKNKE